MQNKQITENKEAPKNIFRKAFKALAKDLWIVILDILAVNLAYFLALMLRFFVNGEFRPTVSYYQTDFLKFAPSASLCSPYSGFMAECGGTPASMT